MRHLLLLLVAFGPLLSAQTPELLHPLSDNDPGTVDKPFGLAMDPDGVHAYVALAGNLAPFGTPPAQLGQFNNDKLLKIDWRSGAIVQIATVGFFPEEVALRTTPSGQLSHIYVTNSTSGTLSVLDAAMNVLATTALTPCFGGTISSIFPFGVAVSPDGTRAIVGTAGGCGDIDLIDADPASPNFGSVIQSFSQNGTFGRPVWVDNTTVVFPQTVCDPGFSWCQGAALILDTAQPANSVSIPLSPQLNFNFDLATDSALLPNGRVLITVGFGNSPLLVEIDPSVPAVTASLDLTGTLDNSLHGLALSPDGRTAAVTVLGSDGEVAFIDVASLSVSSILTTSTGSAPTLPNDLVFSRDGSRAIVTFQGTASLQVLRSLPGYDLRHSAPQTLAIGSSTPLDLENIEEGRQADVYLSLSGPGPQIVGGVAVELSNPFALFGSVTADLLGQGSLPLAVPNVPSLIGLSVWFQAATIDQDGTLRLSAGTRTDIN